MSGWISVKDRLPEYKKFLVTHSSGLLLVTNGKYVYTAEYSEYPEAKTERGRAPRWTSVYGIERDITHWQPLPEPPKD